MLEKIDFPTPVIQLAVEPKTKADQEKLGMAIAKLAQEDPTFKVNTDPETGQTILSGMGELHLEIIVDRMMREFGVAANVGKPQVAYRETIRQMAEFDYTHKKQTGGSGQYARTQAARGAEPRARASNSRTTSRAATSPRNSFRPIEKGVVEALEGGILAGFPMVDLKVSVFDGAYHEVDSSEMAFKICSSICVKEACRKAKPVLLEPVMAVEVVVPEEYMGPVNGDLISRRGQLEGTEIQATTQMIRAECAAERNVRVCDRSALAHAGTRQLHHALLALRRSAADGLGRDRQQGPGQDYQVRRFRRLFLWQKKNLIAVSRT